VCTARTARRLPARSYIHRGIVRARGELPTSKMGQQNPELLAYRLDFAGILVWLLKDAGWTMRCPFLTLPAATVAVVIEGSAIVKLSRLESRCELVHRLVVFLWLLGNVLWASAEFFFGRGPPLFDHTFTWYHGPILGFDALAYDCAVKLTQSIFACGLAMLVCYYITHMRSHLMKKQLRSAQPLGKPLCSSNAVESLAHRLPPVACDLLFIGPWLSKDILWTCNLFWCALPCVALLVLLVVNSMLTEGGQRPKIMLMWVLANFMWMYSELMMDDVYIWPRIVTGAILVSAAALALAGLVSGTSNTFASESKPIV